MMETLSQAEAGEMRLADLRRRIGWICQSVRAAAGAYAVWVLYLLATHWSSVEAINNSHGRMLKTDLSGIEPWQRAAAFALDFGIWLFAAYACYSVWRLFTLYLDSRIFSLEAALWLRRVAFYGAMAQMLDILTRPLISVLLTLHFPADQNQRMVSIYFLPNDLVVLLLLLGLLAMAHIQKTAAEIADEHAQIV